jgi:cation transporter-like permease
MTERPKPLAGMLLLAIAMWAVAGPIGLFAAAIYTRNGGGFIVLIAVLVSLTAFVLGVIAAYRAASALDFIVDSIPQPVIEATSDSGASGTYLTPGAVTPIPAQRNAPESATTATN